MELERLMNATFHLRCLGYLVTPGETTYQRVEDVPNILLPVIPYFLLFIAIECVVAKIANYDAYSVADTLTSIGAGLCSRLPDLLGRSLELVAYIYIYEHYHLYSLPLDSAWTWIFTALAVDCAYYWFHRASHEINFLWAFHQTHHSSEYYNLSTALRQAAIQKYGSSVFYLPLALLLPPSITIMHFQLNFLYQFWIHSEFIGNLGPLEWFLNTASHHRVHHGRNPYAVDKNYAGFLIIWDRMFGTFEPERADEKVAFGLIHNINTFDTFTVQFDHFKQVYRKVRMVWLSKRFDGWVRGVNLLKAIFYGPGWFPSKPHLRMGDRNDLPKVDKDKVVRYGTSLGLWLTIYCFAHGLAVLVVFFSAMLMPAQGSSQAIITIMEIFATLCCIGYICDRRTWCYQAEVLRCCFFLFVGIPHLSQVYNVPGDILRAFYFLFATSLGFVAPAAYSQWSKDHSKME